MTDTGSGSSKFRFNIARRSATFLIGAALLSCGGGDDTPRTPEWSGVTIEVPADADIYTTDVPSIRLRGRSFVPPGSYCNALIGTIGPDYSVRVINTANADTSQADLELGCLLQVNLMWETRYHSVPLVYGDNRITVTASILNGRTGSDAITITRIPDTTPPFVKSVDPADGAANVSYGSSGLIRVTLTFSENVVFAQGDVTVRLSDTGIVAATHEAQPNGTSVALLSFAPQRGTRYEIRADNVRDFGGNPLVGGAFISRFSTAP